MCSLTTKHNGHSHLINTRPPSSTKADDKKFEECIETAYLSGKEIILTGDFNINLTAESSRNHALTKGFKTMTMHFDQLITDVTRPASGTCLDHIYANRSKNIVGVLVLSYALSDHLPTFAVRKNFKQSKQDKQEHSAIKYRNIKGIDDEAFKSTLANSPWDTAFVFDDVNDSLAAWEDIFSQAIDLHAPIKHKQIRKVKQPRWLTRDILDQLSKRDNLLKKARAYNTADAWARYRGARNQATNMITRAKRNYFKASFQNSKGNSKSIWKLIRSLGGDKPTRQPEFLKVTKEKIISTAADIADYFNLHFTTVADKAKRSLLTTNGCNLDKLKQFVSERLPLESQFTISPVTADMVKVYLLKIPANKATGVDGISCALLRLGITELASSIAKLINLSLSSGAFPSRWKRARVTALHKAGNMDDVNNYRPISVLPVLSKIIERHVHDHLSEYLNVHDLIYKNQSGFRKQYSTETALAYIVDTLLFNLDKNHINGMVLIDYKKAFDHVTLLSKLEAYKLDRGTLLWFKSYLTDRTQLVSFKGQTSTVRPITAGVPQGSILGTLKCPHADRHVC